MDRNDGSERTATITVADQMATLTQDGAEATRPAVSAVVNGASFLSGISSASWITITGFNFSSTTRTWGDADFMGSALPTTLDGVRATINRQPAHIFFISPNQLSVLAPDGLPVGQSVQLVVTTAEGSSDPFPVNVLDVDPALFKFDPQGCRYAAAVHADGTFLARPDVFPGANTREAAAGDFVLFFGAGFGATAPETPTSMLVGQPSALEEPVVVRIGGLIAQVQFAGLVSSGLYQFNVVIPEGLEPGDQLVEIFVNGVPIQQSVYITVGG